MIKEDGGGVRFEKYIHKPSGTEWSEATLERLGPTGPKIYSRLTPKGVFLHVEPYSNGGKVAYGVSINGRQLPGVSKTPNVAMTMALNALSQS